MSDVTVFPRFRGQPHDTFAAQAGLHDRLSTGAVVGHILPTGVVLAFFTGSN